MMTSDDEEPLWVDYIEDEMDSSSKQDFELLLAHSSLERDIVNGFRIVKQAVKNSDETWIPQDGEYFQGLHDKIMKRIDRVDDLDRKEGAHLSKKGRSWLKRGVEKILPPKGKIKMMS